MKSLLIPALTLLLALGCAPREAGPHDSELGDVMFWEVVSLESSASSCTDEAEFAAAITPPPLEENSFLMYRVDGATAQSMDCTETLASSCAEGELTFDIEGHTLSLERDAGLVTNVGACNISSLQVWTVVDGGEEGQMSVDMSFPLTGDADDCDAADDILANGGTNGFGLEACTVSLTAELAFFTSN